MDKLGLYPRGASAAAIAAAMEQVMELKRVQPMIHDSLSHLPHWLQEANPMIVTPTFGDEENNHPEELGGISP